MADPPLGMADQAAARMLRAALGPQLHFREVVQVALQTAGEIPAATQPTCGAVAAAAQVTQLVWLAMAGALCWAVAAVAA